MERPRRSAADLAAACLGVLAALLLQGCLSEAPEAPKPAQADGGAPTTQREEPMQVCPSFTFGNGGYVTETQGGDVVEIHCPEDLAYNGPVVECGWVDRFCVASNESDVDPEFCWDQYNLTLKGQSLSEWPADAIPGVVPPPRALSRSDVGERGSWERVDEERAGAAVGRRLGRASASQRQEGADGADARELSARGRPMGGHRHHVSKSAPSAAVAAPERSLPARAPSLPAIFVPDVGSMCVDEGFVDLDIAGAEVLVNNLGGLGPDSSVSRELVYRRVAQDHGSEVDLVITTNASYSAGRPDRNGKGSTMGRININSSAAVPLTFRFVESGPKRASDKPIVLGKVFLTLFNMALPIEGEFLDPEAGGGDLEVQAYGLAQYFLMPEAQIPVQGSSGSPYTFGQIRGPAIAPSTTQWTENDDKETVQDMFNSSLQRTVALVFRDVSEFTLSVKVPPSPDGVELEFAGWSEVAQLGKKVVCERSRSALQDKFDLGETSPIQVALKQPGSQIALLSRHALGRALIVASVFATFLTLIVSCRRQRPAVGELPTVAPQGQYGVLQSVA